MARSADPGPASVRRRPKLLRLAKRAGVLPSFVDHAGEPRTATERALEGVLAALGYDASTEGAAERAFDAIGRAEVERAWPRARVIARDGLGEPLDVACPAGLRGSGIARVEIDAEDGARFVREVAAVYDGGALAMPWPTGVGLGRHRLRVVLGASGKEESREQVLIVHPGAAPSPWPRVGRRGAFGFFANLYTLRSRRRHGMGDLTDLATLARITAEYGGSFVGINPLHALPSGTASPYQPTSRRYRHASYLDIERIPEFRTCSAARELHSSPVARAERARLAASDLVDHEGVAALLWPVLAALHVEFRERYLVHGTERAQRFKRYCREEGDDLVDFATFRVLCERMGERGLGHDWRNWPACVRDPRSAAVARFREDEHDAVERECWVQFEIDRQLGEAAAEGRRAGLSIGLQTDLAVGIPPHSADAWANPGIVATGVSLGAPPDALASSGQDWGLAPWHPARLADAAYEPFAALLRSNLRHAGALRLDHVLGLHRQYWVPSGAEPTDGAYVRFAVEDLLGVAALEATRAGALLIGEDLGTVPEELPPLLRRFGLLSSKVLFFEWDEDGTPRAPMEWEPEALATADTHDTATLAGFASGRDLVRRRELGLVDDSADATARRERRESVRALSRAVHTVEETPGGAAWRAAIHTHLASTRCALVGIAVDDLVGEEEAVNLPGVGEDRFPSWRRRLATCVEDLATDPMARVALGDVARARPRAPREGPRWRATYRLQLHSGFTLRDAAGIAPYLARLGVSHVYLSPVTTARRDSTHGYDAIDHGRVDPRIGGESAWREFVAATRREGLGILVDTVPNHMAASYENELFVDLLARGRGGPGPDWFDVDVGTNGARLVVPLLADDPESMIQRGEVELRIDDGRLWFSFAGARLPVAPSTFTADVATTLAAQPYAPVSWREAARRVPWRRFFDITDLIALRIEREEVARHVHARLFEMVEAGEIDGLRIDHVDGLRDPTTYLRWLRDELSSRRTTAPAAGLWVEKILGEGERLPATWPVEGTTGYEFAADIDAVFVDPDGVAAIERHYREWTAGDGGPASFAEALADGKRTVLEGSLRADVARLARILAECVPGSDDDEYDVVIRAWLGAFDVYRTYAPTAAPAAGDDRERIAAAERRAIAATDERSHALVRSVASLLRDAAPPGGSRRAAEFRARFQQTTGPVMAKGAEDTALYRFAPLASLAEVGAEPQRDTRRAVERLHESNADRARNHPHSLLAASTHDTKRSADTRARLHVLSWVADEWIQRIGRWQGELAPRIVAADLPDARACHAFYQSLVGIWPTTDGSVPSPGALGELCERLVANVRKAAREAKLATSWTEPDAEYEGRLERFVRALLDPRRGAPFLSDVAAWVAWIAPSAAWAGAVRRVLQSTSPGVPDLYQGDESTFLALVDPDNRRGVDFTTAGSRLAEVELASRTPALATRARQLASDVLDGRLALHVVHSLLRARADDPAPFGATDYRPLTVLGPRANDVFAFLRAEDGEALLVAVPRRFRPAGPERPPLGALSRDWQGHELVIPPDVSVAKWSSPLTGESCHHCRPGHVSLEQLLAVLPLAVYFARPSDR